MSFKTLLLHLTDDAEAAARTQTAIALAERFDARLVGLSISTPDFPALLEGSGATASIWADSAMRADADARARARRFEEATAATTAATEARLAAATGADAGATLARHARFADLTLVASPRSDASDRDGRAGALEGALFDGGGPILALPAQSGGVATARRILVAWDGRREASRAARDALPFLRAAERVEICVVDTLLRGADDGDAPGADCAQWLARHGVTADAHAISRNFGVATALLQRAGEIEADLIVMGGYGHARLTEAMFGGVTETLLRESGRSLFMAH